MREAVQRTVKGATYLIAPLPALRAQRVFYRLNAALGPSLATLAAGAIDRGSGLAVSPDVIGSAVARLLSGIGTADEYERLVMELLQGVLRNGRAVADPDVFNIDYAGNLAELFLALREVLEVNYGDFFAGADTGNLWAYLERLGRQTSPASSPTS